MENLNETKEEAESRSLPIEHAAEVEETVKKTPLWRRPVLPATIAIVAAVILVASFFLPYASAVEEYRESLEAVPDAWLDESLGMTASDIVDLSLFEYANAYASMASNGWGDSWMIIAGLIASVGVFAVLTLLFALLRKATPTALFAALTLAVSQIVSWDFAERGVMPSNSYEPGLSTMLLIVASVIAIAAAIWLFIAKFKAKRENS
ncbi:hypothetical protein [uncultured Slackia sp.]|uniref:hypothetical protein n=1 Tax=uncultured Slackia sp. TaxID=665903 RepID=UPI0025CEB8B2|nr:hypothetical protein [uncultured Slackia sp.]